ncbi:MAG: GntP family permease [Gemmobacter sp.]|jgi:H+/gluconate symporter-like permease|nr:GntP family permease [Gemmobacter sp.]
MLGLIGIFVALGLLMWLAYSGRSVLISAPIAAVVAAAFSGEPLLAHWTLTYMGAAAGFIAQWFPMFLLGALFGKLMEDSGSITSIAQYLTDRLGTRRTMLSVVLISALVTYGGVSVFVVFFVLVPMARQMFRAADIPGRLLPATVGLGACTFTLSAIPGTPSINNSVPIPYFGTTTFAAPGLGIIAAAVILAVGMWWLHRAEAKARRAGEGYGRAAEPGAPVISKAVRERAASAREFDLAELSASERNPQGPRFTLAIMPLLAVIVTNLLMSLVIFPASDYSFLAEPRWGETSIGAVSGAWSVVIALGVANLTVLAINGRTLPSLRESLDAGANAAALPMMMIASLVGFGAVVVTLPAFSMVRDAVFAFPGGPLVQLAVAVNVLAGLTGTAAGGVAIVLNAFGEDFMRLATEHGIDPQVMHRITTISAGTLDTLPHNGTILLLLQLSGMSHRESYFDLIMTVIVSCIAGLVAVVALASVFGSF